ncbi:MAG: CHAD domain-containing protein, partial [Microthrixaceae bacterium]
MSSTATTPSWTMAPEDRTQPAGRVFALVLDAQLADLRRHEPAVLGDHDPVHLHDLRVALRRARSLVSAGRGVFPDGACRALAADMRDLSRITSQVRDLDVLIEAVAGGSSTISEELAEGTELLLAALRLRRRTVFVAMEHHLGSEQQQRMVRTWQHLGSVYRVGGEAPGPDSLRATGRVVDAALEASFRRVRSAGRRAQATGELEDWHEVRKRLKRLRYLVVAFAPLYPEGSLDPAVRSLRKLQNVLGRLQDHATDIELVESVGIAVGGRAALTAGALSDQLHRATAEDLLRCPGAWDRFDERSVRR